MISKSRILMVLFSIAAIVAARPARSAADDASEEKVKTELRDLAQETYKWMDAAYTAGTTSSENVYLWSRLWMDAEIALSGKTPEEGVKAVQAHLERMKALHGRVNAFLQAGRDHHPAPVSQAVYYVKEAELMLLKRKKELR